MTPRTTTGWPVLLLLAFAQFIVAIDYNIVYVALPHIGDQMGFSEPQLQWVISAYAVTFGGFLLLGGRAADRLGQRRMFALALGLYAASSLVAGFAAHPAMLVAMRAVQGLGGALLAPATLALIGISFPEGPRRNRAIAVWSASGGLGLAAGALLGGILTAAFGWEAVFFVNVPLAGGAILAAFVLLRRDTDDRAGGSFDLPGAVTVTGGSTALVLAVVEGPGSGWGSSHVLAAIGIAIVLLTAFFVIQRRNSDPLMPSRMLSYRGLTTSMIASFVFMGTFGVQYYILTVYLQDVLAYGALATGIAFLVPALSAIAGTKLAQFLLARQGIRFTLVAGLLLGAGGMAGLGLGLEGGYAVLLPGLIVTSLGQGATFTATFIASSSGVDSGQQGIASAMTTTTQQIGSAVGLAVMVAIIGAGASLSGGLRLAEWVAVALTLVGALIVRIRMAAGV